MGRTDPVAGWIGNGQFNGSSNYILEFRRYTFPVPDTTYNHPMICLHCGAAFVVTSPMKIIFIARRECPNCHKEVLIENGKAVPDTGQDRE
jgi:hypothetical protein